MHYWKGSALSDKPVRRCVTNRTEIGGFRAYPVGMSTANQHAELQARLSAALEATQDLRRTFQDVRDEHLPGSSLYLALDSAVGLADDAERHLSSALDAARFR